MEGTVGVMEYKQTEACAHPFLFFFHSTKSSQVIGSWRNEDDRVRIAFSLKFFFFFFPFTHTWWEVGFGAHFVV